MPNPCVRIAGMARSYRYLQAERRNCPQFAARQRGIWTTGHLLQRMGRHNIAAAGRHSALAAMLLH